MQLSQELEAKQSLPALRSICTRDLFILYADRKLMTPEMIARLATQFHLPKKRTDMHVPLHADQRDDICPIAAIRCYNSRGTPSGKRYPAEIGFSAMATSAAVGIDGPPPIRWTHSDAAMFAYCWLNRPPRNSNDAIAIKSYCASLAKRDTNSLAVSYLKGACSFDEKRFWVALMKGSPRHES